VAAERVAAMAGGSALDMAAFVSALPAVGGRPLAAADGRRCVAGGGVHAASAAAAAGGVPRRARGVSMVAASKGPAGGPKSDAPSRKPVINDDYTSVPTERIRNLSIIAHIDHGAWGAWSGEVAGRGGCAACAGRPARLWADDGCRVCARSVPRHAGLLAVLRLAEILVAPRGGRVAPLWRALRLYMWLTLVWLRAASFLPFVRLFDSDSTVGWCAFCFPMCRQIDAR